jgi:hypothetical protein
MERLSRLIRKLNLPGDTCTPEELARSVWPVAVGKKIASHARPTGMVRSRLVVEVEDVVWQRQLFALSRQIVANLEKHLGAGVVEEIQFRVVPRRREPQRATYSTTVPLLAADEAEGISDPVLRVIYKASRRKALA